MEDKPVNKGLLNEILPDPKRAAKDLTMGSPRHRTAEHLKKVLAAGLALQLSGEVACGSGAPPKASPSPTPRPNEPSGYGVVDPLPDPAVLEMGQAAAAIRKLVADYARAIEGRDLARIKTLMPNLTRDEERRLRDAFKDRRTHTVRIAITTMEVAGTQATVHLSRMDTIEGQPEPSQMTFQLSKGPGGWTIRSIER